MSQSGLHRIDVRRVPSNRFCGVRGAASDLRGDMTVESATLLVQSAVSPSCLLSSPRAFQREMDALLQPVPLPCGLPCFHVPSLPCFHLSFFTLHFEESAPRTGGGGRKEEAIMFPDLAKDRHPRRRGQSFPPSRPCRAFFAGQEGV